MRIKVLTTIARYLTDACNYRSTAAGLAIACVVGIIAVDRCRAENPREASTSEEAMNQAIRSIPYRQLAPIDRQKVDSVLSSISAYRRLPVRVTACDPELYDFLSTNPDVVIGIWRTLKLTQLHVRRLNGNTFQFKEPDGSLAIVQIIYRSPKQLLIYGEGIYHGQLMLSPVRGRFLLSLRSSFLRDVNDKYFVTARLDTFFRVESTGADLIVKTLHPLFGSVVDNNFTQTVAFLGSLSKTAEINCTGIQRLAMGLTDVPVSSRRKLVELVEKIGGQPTRSVASTTKPTLHYVGPSSAVPPRGANQPLPAWNVPRSLLPSGQVDPRGASQAVPVPPPVIPERPSGYTHRRQPTHYQ